MNKSLLLARAHFRKNKGTSIGLLCLLIITAMLLCLSLLMVTDAYPLASIEAERLDSGDGFFRITEDLTGLDEQVFDEILEEDTGRHYTYQCLNYIMSVPFAGGDMSCNFQFCDGDTAFNKGLARSEIVTEDTSVTTDYVILPYQFYTSGGYKIGDDFNIVVQGNKYDLKVRGFLTTPYFGCNNSGSYEVVVDDDTYSEMNSIESPSLCYIVVYELKEGVKDSAFGIRFLNDCLTYAPGSAVSHVPLDVSISNRTFVSLIFVIAFMSVTLILMLVVLMMLINSISNYIKESMKTLGALKAIGYTSRDIKVSLHILFTLLAVIGSVAGILISYVSMPIFSKIVVAQMGIPYKVSVVLLPTLLILVIVVLYTMLVTEAALHDIRRIEPIVALRDGTEGHSFKRNRVRLDKSDLRINIALALKTTLFNIKQNIISFVVVGAMVFLCTLGVLMYENFNVHPKIEMLSFEFGSGVAAFDNTSKEEAKEYLESLDGVSNVRNCINLYFCYGDEERLYTYIMDDVSKLDNKNVCYEGRLPQYDNEVAVSGKFCREYGLSVGDILELTYGDETYGYLITGLIQTTNNQGKEAVMNETAASHIVDLTDAPAYYHFDCDEETSEASDKVLDKCEEKFGSHMISRMNFYDIIEGALTTFKMVAVAMLSVMFVVSALVILLVLYLLVKSLILNKRKDYGILKAIGYKTSDLVIQTAVSFMPSILISVIVFSVLSYHLANPFMNLAMGSFGIVKADFTVPIPGVVLVSIFITAISFAFAILESRKIRKIEAYKMLVSE
ncbi:MAG: ABC transporter permease [Saccharofermentans sp.]|nr:ABC transporter permease [Saccharofermentans sp.]